MVQQKYTNDMSQRQQRLAELVRQIVAQSLTRGLVDSAVATRLSVSYVWVSKDVRHATVYFTMLGGPDETPAALEALDYALPRLQAQLGKEMSTKFTPRLKFAYDDHAAHAARIDALITGTGKR